MAKRCNTCRLVLPADAFSTRKASRDGLQNRCRACWRSDYVANRAQRKAAAASNARATLRRHRERLQCYLEDHPCVDCGEADIRCLDFDHRDPGQKLANVSQLVSTHVRWQRILDEIEKCEVRCANCHRKRTAEQQHSWRHRRWLASTVPQPAGAIRLSSVMPQGASEASVQQGGPLGSFRKARPGVYSGV